ADRAPRVLVAVLALVILLVAASTERLVAGAGQNDGADLVIPARRHERLDQLHAGARAECVVTLRPVDGNGRDALGGVVRDVGVAHRVAPSGLLPASVHALWQEPAAGCTAAPRE